MIVPAIPELELGVLLEHEAAHRQLADEYQSSPTDAVCLFAVQQRRIVIESLAHVWPVIARRPEVLTMVPPRAFLDSKMERRMMGCTTLLRYIDGGVAMERLGYPAPAIERGMLATVHALAESAAPRGHTWETNPGMFRTELTKWEDQPVNYTHPPAAAVAELVDAALEVARAADVPACVRAGWLTFTLLSIHPFVDGNGRSARAMYMAAVAQSTPLGIDWGVLEQWAIWRREYIVNNQIGQAYGRFEPAEMDAGPFVEFATRASIQGVAVCVERLRFFVERLDALEARGLTREEAVVLTFVQMWRMATLAEIATCGIEPDRVDRVVHDLLTAGRLRWTSRPHSRRTFDAPEAFGLVAVDSHGDFG